MGELRTVPSFDWVRGESWNVTFTRGITPDDVLSRYGAVPRDARVMPLREALRLGHDSYGAGTPKSVLRVGMVGDWSFCYEEWGVLGCAPRVLSALSRDGETFAVHTDANALDAFAHWRDGRCAESVELDAARAIRRVGDRTGAVPDDAMVGGPLPTVLLAEPRTERKP
ncbi:DUF6461 domain-containing protein [Streptomyces sp. NPDC059477]|uniref:DUF6461 domain-containing protein n=1 Tax=Streptomyces sp. NPDC059477 TaxID=3346847 RepID=UPI0036808FBE